MNTTQDPARQSPQAQLDALTENIAAGTRELRRYVEGNGFEWCEDESAVFNVTTALGLMGGALEAQKAQLDAANARITELETALRHIGEANRIDFMRGKTTAKNIEAIIAHDMRWNKEPQS